MVLLYLVLAKFNGAYLFPLPDDEPDEDPEDLDDPEDPEELGGGELLPLEREGAE